MPINYPYTQYGGVWNLTSQSQAKGAGTWAALPQPYLYAWGQNNQGQLGLGNTTYYSSPKQVGSLTNWSSVACGFYCTIAVKTDGTLWSWGQNVYGQLGLNNITYYSSPKQVGALTNWSSTATGAYHVIAVKTDGTLWGWGQNGVGNLGLGNTTNYSSPKQIGSLTNWSKVACGNSHTIAVKTDGTLWGWGSNGSGALGLNNNVTSYSSPKQIGALTNWSIVTCGNNYTLAIKTDGTLWSWGLNSSGQLGYGSASTNYSSPKQVGALTTWSNISAGNSFSIATKTDGTFWSWGKNSSGQLGLGNLTYYSSPKQVGALTNWSLLSGAENSAFAIKTDGTFWSWGYNVYGQLGFNNVTNYSSPKQVGSLTTWITLFKGPGAYLTVAIAKT